MIVDNEEYFELLLFVDFLFLSTVNEKMLDSNSAQRRQDLFQTSTGVGHQYRPGYYFPSTNFKVLIRFLRIVYIKLFIYLAGFYQSITRSITCS